MSTYSPNANSRSWCASASWVSGSGASGHNSQRKITRVGTADSPARLVASGQIRSRPAPVRLTLKVAAHHLAPEPGQHRAVGELRASGRQIPERKRIHELLDLVQVSR